MEIMTKFGTITESIEDFGYGIVWCSDGEIRYMDATWNKGFKTVKGFERFAERYGYDFKTKKVA